VLFSEPKIPQSNGRACERLASARFQCSSASRKFLNAASSASPRRSPAVSVLFSEPKIPQFRGDGGADRVNEVSVLFSEPKIPQLSDPSLARLLTSTFQCSSASRKFLNSATPSARGAPALVSVLFSEPKIPQFRSFPTSSSKTRRFQCSSASRKFLNRDGCTTTSEGVRSFSALQRAENSSINPA